MSPTRGSNNWPPLIEKEGGELIIDNLKRNGKGHIIAISLTFRSGEGGYVTGNYNEEYEINSIYFGTNEKGGLFITTHETALTDLKKGKIPEIKNQISVDSKVYSIFKNTSEEDIKIMIEEIAKENGELIIENLKRNSKDLIISLTVGLKVSDFGRATKTFNLENGIEPILFGRNNKGGHSFLRNAGNGNKLKKGETSPAKVQEIKNATVYSIDKNTSDAGLKKLKSTIENKGGEFTYTHKRNSKGEITSYNSR